MPATALPRLALLLAAGAAATAAAGAWLLVRAPGPGGALGIWLREAQRGQALAADSGDALARVERADRAVRALAEGRMTLVGAAAHIAEVHRQLLELYPRAPLPFPDLPEEERACRVAIQGARICAGEGPAGKVLTTRLEGEPARLQARGPLQLPPPPALPSTSRPRDASQAGYAVVPLPGDR